MLLEVYARIKDFEQYAISNYGEVINVKTGNKLKPYTNENGYLEVGLSKNKRTHTKRIHRLVGIAFIDKINEKSLIDHKDCNKTNNRLDNLRWCNNSENMRNSKISSRNNSGVRGVSFDKEKQKWKAVITVNGKIMHIGYFEDLEVAKIARQDKSKEIFGEFLHSCEK